MIFRLATKADIAALVDMRWDYTTDRAQRTGKEYEQFRQYCATFLQRSLAGGLWAVWVAESHNNEIVSHIYLQIIEKVPKAKRLRNMFVYMTNVYTKPEWRGQGIGGRLLHEACAWSQENNLEFIIVWPSEEAVGFYARTGFQAVKDAMDLHFFE
jgi:GNAT superfamily N-acetyltransferase